MSLLNRLPTASSASLAQTANGSAPQPARPSPFGPRPGNPPLPPSRPAQPAGPAVQYTILPIGETMVRFQLKGLGDPFHRMLGEALNLDYGTPQKAADVLQKDDALRQRVSRLLDEAWAGYHMVGAMLLTPYDVTQRVYTSPLYPMPLSDDDEETPPTPAPPRCEFVRAIDLTLVLNILARVRDGILVAETPLALEPAFLDKIWVTSDVRLVKLARATGCLENVWA